MVRFLQPQGFWLLTGLAGMAMVAGRVFRHSTREPEGGSPSSPSAPSSRPWLWLALRTLAVLCVTLALARPVWDRPQPFESRVFVADLSDSIPPTLQQAEAEWISRQLTRSDSHHPAAVVAFGESALVERPLRPQATQAAPSPTQGFLSRPGGSATHIEAALELAASLIPPGLPARLVLLSDGGETDGSALQQVERLRQRNLPVDVLTLPTHTGEEVAVVGLRAPSRIASTQPSLAATILIERFGPPLTVPLEVTVAGSPVYRASVALHSGKNSVRLSLPLPPDARQSNTFAVEVTLTADPRHDQQPGNNRSAFLVRVSGPARYLVVTSDPAQSLAAPLLQQQGLTVDVLPPAALPAQVGGLAGWAAIVFEDLPAYTLTDLQLKAVQRYVEQAGGGLFVIGGPNSYGPGGYFGTPLEQVLPVYSEAPERVFAPSLALLLLIDQSGSMGDLVATESSGSTGTSPASPSASAPMQTKLDLAKQAALAAASVLSPADLIGVISFQTSPIWAVPLQRAENQLLIRAQLSRLLPGGGTAIAPALQQAAALLPGVQAMVKHVLLLTDGRGETNDYSALIQQLRKAGATLTTVAVGQDADQALLQEMARQGSGRFYAADPRQVPRIFVTETQSVTRDLRRDETFVPLPAAAGPAPFWPSQEPLPPLHGYVMTTPKPQAQLWYIVPSQKSPLLVGGRFGLGQSVVFTSGLAGRWGESWRRWPQLGAFLAQIVRSLANVAADEQLRSRLEFHGGEARLILEAVRPDGTYRSFLHPTATLAFPSGHQENVALQEQQPGLYVGEVAAAESGPYLATFTVPSETGTSPPERTQAVALQPYPAEYRQQQSRRPPLLFELATLTGGHLLTFDSDAWSVGGRQLAVPVPLTALFLALAALSFLADLSVRYVPAGSLGRLRQWWGARLSSWRHRRRAVPARSPASPAGPAPSTPTPAPGHTLAPAAIETSQAQDPLEELLRERLAHLYEERRQILSASSSSLTNAEGKAAGSAAAPTDSLQQAWRYLARRRRSR